MDEGDGEAGRAGNKLEENGLRKAHLTLPPLALSIPEPQLTFLLKTRVWPCSRVGEATAPDYGGVDLGWLSGDPWQSRVSIVHKMQTKLIWEAGGPLKVVHQSPNCVSSKVHLILHSCSKTEAPAWASLMVWAPLHWACWGCAYPQCSHSPQLQVKASFFSALGESSPPCTEESLVGPLLVLHRAICIFLDRLSPNWELGTCVD